MSEPGTKSIWSNADVRLAYRAGQEAMREAVAVKAFDLIHAELRAGLETGPMKYLRSLPARLAFVIRALPIKDAPDE